ncbi:Na+/H+ antiporter NhaC family protein [Lutispora saccharofermentans]|uniref:Na+/H+ antiporter NhaC-like C-terminal domain-containing protein n=1 Tax=Lutispora saccharofermentans TaxID=3024236 RepID=A0ABT1NE98_9FIRM|nr:Na+/H+ antiporter NhaC family protein [Lutispora saccharofermentans]MCQ1528166.1 hypothetical protein [Lutispora saccharofermentans]
MKKNIPYFQCVAVIVTLSVSLILNIFVFNKPLYFGLIIGLIASFIVGIINGYDIRILINFAYAGLKKSSKVLIMLSMIAMLIGIWKIGGVIPAMLYYSFGMINERIFLVSSFIISSAISMLMGTSTGTVSSVGIVLLGLGSAMNIPLPAIAGTVVSGAFFGDRSSPISSVFNLVSTMTETNPHENFKYLLKTISIGAALAIIFYFVIGLNYADMSANADNIIDYKNLMTQYVRISPLLLIPPVILMVFYVLKFTPLYTMAASVAIGAIFSIAYQRISIIELVKAAFVGFHPSIPAEYSVVLAGGGLVSFRTMLIVIVCATSLNGVFEGTKMVETLIKPVLKRIKTSRELMLFTVGFSIVSALFMCNQVISIIIPSGVLLERYKAMGIDKKEFARLLSDSGVMVSSIIPWNVAALTPASIMGVSVISYLPYAFLSYIMPIISAANILFFQNNSLELKRGNINEKSHS